MTDGLEKENNLFESKRAEWLVSHKDQWVWINDSDAKFYPSYELAVEAAYKAGFDSQPIYIKQVTEKDETPTIAKSYSWAV